MPLYTTTGIMRRKHSKSDVFNSDEVSFSKKARMENYASSTSECIVYDTSIQVTPVLDEQGKL